jgi:hypothetical protein
MSASSAPRAGAGTQNGPARRPTRTRAVLLLLEQWTYRTSSTPVRVWLYAPQVVLVYGA